MSLCRHIQRVLFPSNRLSYRSSSHGIVVFCLLRVQTATTPFQQTRVPRPSGSDWLNRCETPHSRLGPQIPACDSGSARCPNRGPSHPTSTGSSSPSTRLTKPGADLTVAANTTASAFLLRVRLTRAHAALRLWSNQTESPIPVHKLKSHGSRSSGNSRLVTPLPLPIDGRKCLVAVSRWHLDVQRSVEDALLTRVA